MSGVCVSVNALYVISDGNYISCILQKFQSFSPKWKIQLSLHANQLLTYNHDMVRGVKIYFQVFTSDEICKIVIVLYKIKTLNDYITRRKQNK